MKILKYGIFCFLVFAASIMIRRPAGVEKAQIKTQVLESQQLPVSSAHPLGGGRGGDASPEAPLPEKADGQKPPLLVTRPFEDNSSMGPTHVKQTETSFTMTEKSATLGPLFVLEDNDQKLRADQDNNLAFPEAGLEMDGAWQAPLFGENPFNDDQDIFFGEDDGSALFSDDFHSDALSNGEFGNEEQE
jgi:hypothetical protein